MATAVTNQDAPPHASTPTRFRHQRLRDALRELPPLDDATAVRGALRALFEDGWLDLPAPGARETRTRFRCFVEAGAHDLSLARLIESHADALAILHEAGKEPEPGAIYGVWSGRSVERLLRAECTAQGWLLHGEVPCCPGVNAVDRALVVAWLPEPMVFEVPRSALARMDVEPCVALGLAAADSCTVHLAGCQLPVDALIGAPGFFVSRRGLWAGAIGVSAVWLGGAVGTYRMWQSQMQHDPSDAHAPAHLGAAFASLSAAGQVLHDAAHAIDAGESASGLQRRALWTRHVVGASCLDVLDRAGRALGNGPTLFNAAQARRAVDLPAYVREANTERDLAALGELVSKLGDVNWL